MKAAALAALLVGLLAVTTVASPLVAAALAAAGWSFRFTRVYNRVFEVLLVVGIVLGWRRLDLGDPVAWGFRRERWQRDLVAGLALGLVGVGAALALAWAYGGVVPALRFAPVKTVRKALAGLAGAVIVGVGEEALFRGILLRRFDRDLGPRAGLVVMTVVYAVVHALRGGPQIVGHGWEASWARTIGLFAPLGDAAAWGGAAGLFLLGLVLAVTRQRTGSLWASIGIHAAWVGVFRVGRLFLDIRDRPVWVVGAGWPPLVGGAAGALGIVVTALVVAAWLRRRGGGALHEPPRRFRS